jgi:hypothetical protein
MNTIISFIVNNGKDDKMYGKPISIPLTQTLDEMPFEMFIIHFKDIVIKLLLLLRYYHILGLKDLYLSCANIVWCEIENEIHVNVKDIHPRFSITSSFTCEKDLECIGSSLLLKAKKDINQIDKPGLDFLQALLVTKNIDDAFAHRYLKIPVSPLCDVRMHYYKDVYFHRNELSHTSLSDYQKQICQIYEDLSSLQKVGVEEEIWILLHCVLYCKYTCNISSSQLVTYFTCLVSNKSPPTLNITPIFIFPIDLFLHDFPSELYTPVMFTLIYTLTNQYEVFTFSQLRNLIFNFVVDWMNDNVAQMKESPLYTGIFTKRLLTCLKNDSLVAVCKNNIF